MGFKRILIVQGIEGNEDVPTSRPCRAFIWEESTGEATEFRIDPSEYGLQAATKEEMAGGDSHENAAIALRVFDGEPGGYRDLVVFNAGVRIWLTERTDSIAEGVELARQAIDSGQAKQKLGDLQRAK
jgi:anthranilate phosphoribosyltransferase